MPVPAPAIVPIAEPVVTDVPATVAIATPIVLPMPMHAVITGMKNINILLSAYKVDDKHSPFRLRPFPCKVLCNQPPKTFGNGHRGTGIDNVPGNGEPADRQLCGSSADHRAGC